MKPATPGKNPFFALFAKACIRRNSRSYRDYKKGKDLLADLPPDEYERGIRELTAYLSL